MQKHVTSYYSTNDKIHACQKKVLQNSTTTTISEGYNYPFSHSRLTSYPRASSLRSFLGHFGSPGRTDRDPTARRPFALCIGHGVVISHQRDLGRVDRADSGGILARPTMEYTRDMPRFRGNRWFRHGPIEFVAVGQIAQLEKASALRGYSCSLG